MKATELQGKSPDELKTVILDSKRELLNLRFQAASGELENSARFRVVKKTIARAFTMLNQNAAV